jgi:hypothetical protein
MTGEHSMPQCPLHDSLQRVATEACALSKRIKDTQERWDEDYREVFHGDNSMKTRILRTEEDMKGVKSDIQASNSMFKWIIGGLVVIFLAVTGGTFTYLADQIGTLQANQITYMETLGIKHK